ncbi:hypothetical protein VTL71DRAFT_12297 [Oculimacula yallundae]|uniref:Uncharacterized protein n=1 Tax=Oculimacula yallundae TaxID=86028 RepID=A0ABR4CM71_9HELO
MTIPSLISSLSTSLGFKKRTSRKTIHEAREVKIDTASTGDSSPSSTSTSLVSKQAIPSQTSGTTDTASQLSSCNILSPLLPHRHHLLTTTATATHPAIGARATAIPCSTSYTQHQQLQRFDFDFDFDFDVRAKRVVAQADGDLDGGEEREEDNIVYEDDLVDGIAFGVERGKSAAINQGGIKKIPGKATSFLKPLTGKKTLLELLGGVLDTTGLMNGNFV